MTTKAILEAEKQVNIASNFPTDDGLLELSVKRLETLKKANTLLGFEHRRDVAQGIFLTAIIATIAAIAVAIKVPNATINASGTASALRVVGPRFASPSNLVIEDATISVSGGAEALGSELASLSQTKYKSITLSDFAIAGLTGAQEKAGLTFGKGSEVEIVRIAKCLGVTIYSGGLAASVLATQRDRLERLKVQTQSDDRLIPVRGLATDEKPIWLNICGTFSNSWQLYGNASELDISEHLRFGDDQFFSIPSLKDASLSLAGKDIKLSSSDILSLHFQQGDVKSIPNVWLNIKEPGTIIFSASGRTTDVFLGPAGSTKSRMPSIFGYLADNTLWILLYSFVAAAMGGIWALRKFLLG